MLQELTKTIYQDSEIGYVWPLGFFLVMPRDLGVRCVRSFERLACEREGVGSDCIADGNARISCTSMLDVSCFDKA
jgi:hypothetical protein